MGQAAFSSEGLTREGSSSKRPHVIGRIAAIEHMILASSRPKWKESVYFIESLTTRLPFKGPV